MRVRRVVSRHSTDEIGGAACRFVSKSRLHYFTLWSIAKQTHGRLHGTRVVSRAKPIARSAGARRRVLFGAPAGRKRRRRRAPPTPVEAAALSWQFTVGNPQLLGQGRQSHLRRILAEHLSVPGEEISRLLLITQHMEQKCPAHRSPTGVHLSIRQPNHSGSSHKCMHDLAPGRSATAVGRRCGCARARYAAVQSSVAQLTAACAGPALGGGPARRQPDQTQAADSMALTWPRTVKASGTRPRLSPMFCAGAERSLTVQPPWNWQPRHDSGVCCGRTFREPATPLQIQTVFFSHVSH